MKDKIKKFYQEHKEEVVIGGILATGYVILTTVYAVELNRMRGYQVLAVGTNFNEKFTENDSIVLHLRNGDDAFYRPPSE